MINIFDMTKQIFVNYIESLLPKWTLLWNKKTLFVSFRHRKQDKWFVECLIPF